MKALLDTNTLVSALLQPLGPSGQIVTRWRARDFKLVVSPYILTELAYVLHRPHITKKHSIREQDIQNFLRLLRTRAQVAPGMRILDVVPDDPKDNHILAAALETYCDYLVSGDRHLLDLHEYQGIKIVAPREFLALLVG